MTTHEDPVCGMAVDEATERTSEYEGKKYSFCSKGCQTKFDANPASYAPSTR